MVANKIKVKTQQTFKFHSLFHYVNMYLNCV